MKFRLLSVALTWSFVALFLVTLTPGVYGLDWAVSINPSTPPAINAGENVTISMTGPDDATIYVEIVNANTTELLFRFPSTDGEFITLTGGLAVIIWSIPSNLNYTGELLYAQLKDETTATRDIISFRIDAVEVIDPDDPVDEVTLSELQLEIQRLNLWRTQFQKSFDRLLAQNNEQMAIMMTFLFIAVIASAVALASAFSDRYPKLKSFFGGEKEREDKTEKELKQFIEFFVMKEIPVKFREAFEAIMEEEEKQVEEIPVAEEPEPELKAEKLMDVGDKKPKKERRKKGMYIKTCEFCGEEFQSKVRLAKYCPDKDCRLKAFRQRKRERDGENE